ncbi:hypothetical protein cypCar_00036626 [Cyprinus carpio]|nr:hypothetical protein cypCar_00036626 [Cyprinus carpio]
MVYFLSAEGVKPSFHSAVLFNPAVNYSDGNGSSTPTPIVCRLDASSSAASLQSNVSLTSYELSPAEVTLLGLVFGVFWVVSVLGNSLVCLVIHRSRRTQSTTNYFVVSMACADLLLSLACAPLVLLQVSAGHWPLTAAACKAVRYSHTSMPWSRRSTASVHLLDRSKHRLSKPLRTSSLWHSWDGVAYAVAHLLLGFLVPALLIVSFYQRVVRYIWRIGADGRTVRRTMNIVPRTKVKTIKMFLMLNAVFLLTWTPFYVAQLWHPKETTGPSRQSALFFIAVAWISFSSTASRIAKKNYVGVIDLPVPAKTLIKDSVYDTFDREAKEKK